ncbi:response regulator [Candidatus Albibeggiatoa sp. nov. NOAA]|uniref:response regulator n=1 Tax=Candidatus Albibeggiatoa sp. nov. NOAA TaxID=3162724 RepID=UPI0032F7AB9B|nr:response regulator [Thiotrichaceae bacterium]
MIYSNNEQLQQQIDNLQQRNEQLDSDNQTLSQALQQLRAMLQKLEEENNDLHISLETSAEHSDTVEAELVKISNNLEQEIAIRTQELADNNNRLKREIQERKRVEEVQRNSLLLRQTLLNSIPNPIFFKNNLGMYLGCNHGFEKYIGRTESEIVGHTARELYPPERASLEEQRDRALFNSEHDTVQIVEDRVKYADDSIHDVMFNTTTFKTSDGSVAGLVGIIIDISEHKRAEEALLKAKDAAEDANRIKSQFIANMSHELRTPLNAILGYSEMLEEDIADFGLHDLVADVRKINAAGKHLLGLINDVLDISKIEAGKMSIYAETFSIQNMVSDVISTIRPLIQTRDNTLSLNMSNDIGNMHADLTKLRQMLFNLLSNAAKFTEKGHISFTVLRKIEPEQDWIHFKVSDEGIGMTAEQMQKLFQPFTQADASTTRKYGGTGLGLTISQRFAEMMGGKIYAESEYGYGSCFTIQLPAYVIAEQDPVVEGLNAPKPAEKRQAGNTVLIIDDDAIVRELLQNYIKKLGFQVIVAESGHDGLELARKYKPHAITLDVMMPGMDGWMVLSELKNDPVLAKIPVIMVSLIEDKSIGYSLGASEYLTKPVNRDELNRVLRKYLTDDENSQKILVVEDDDVTRNLIESMLQKIGWQVETSENGQVALNRLLQSRPDLILSDLMMPEMDGFELITKLRKEPEWRQIPVVVLTAKDMTPGEREMLNNRVEKVFQKGDYRLDELLNEIRECLTRAKLIKHPKS